MKRVLHIGLDVDDNSFHIGGFCKETGEIFEMTSKPNLGSLMKKLQKFKEQNFDIKLCYEATYIGYTVCRNLNTNGFKSEIIAPSMIPELSSNRVKTDRLDAMKLAKYYSNDLLTPIHIPSQADEHERDLLRGRSFLVGQRKTLKKHILSACRRNNIDYKSETGGKAYWIQKHENWLIDKINKLTGSIKLNFKILYRQYEKINEGITEYDKAIAELAETEK